MNRSFAWTLRSILLLLPLMASIGLLEAQSVFSLTGMVVDDAEAPLPGANVVLIKDGESSSARPTKGGITAQNGHFSLTGIPAGQYTLRISFVGYSDYSKSISIQRNTKLDTIQLSEGGLLDDVLVTGKATEITVKGDTLVFNADSYKLTAGSTLEDLVKRLPGAQVDKNGTITINGEVVSKIMIDGKEFFAGDPSIAAKNLPAEMINKLEVLNKKSDQARLTGFDDDQEQTVINLSTKMSNKKGSFGNAFVGSGLDNLFEVNGIFNRFADKNQWTILAGGDNTNGRGKDELDTDNAQMDMRGGGGSGGGRFSDRNLPDGGVSSAFNIGFNDTWVPNKLFELNGNGRYNYTSNDYWAHSKTENIFSNANSTLIERSIIKKTNLNDFGVDGFIKWIPSEKIELNLRPNVHYSRSQSGGLEKFWTKNKETGQDLNSGEQLQNNTRQNLRGGNRAILSYRLNDEGRTLSAMLNVNFRNNQNETHTDNRVSIREDGTITNILQKLNTRSQSFDYRARLNFVEPIASSLLLQTMVQMKQEYRHSDHLIDYTKNTLPTTHQELQLNNRLTTIEGGVHLKWFGSKFDLTAGVNVSPTQLRTEQILSGTPTRIEQWQYFVSPTLNFRYEPNRTTSLKIRYWSYATTPRSSQMFSVPDFSETLNEVIGNPNLAPEYRHGLGILFRSFVAQTQQSVSLGVHLYLNQNEIIQNTTIDPKTGKQSTTFVNTPYGYGARFFGIFNTPLFNKLLNLSFSTRNSYGVPRSIINGENNITHSSFNHEELALSYTNDWLYIRAKGSIDYALSMNSLRNYTSAQSFGWNTGGDLSLTLPFGFKIDTNAAYTETQGFNGEKTNFFEWDAALSYSFLPKNAATIRFKVYDILNQSSDVQRHISPAAITDTWVNSLGRYAMLHFIFRFSAFSGGASRKDMRPMSQRQYPRYGR